MNGRILRLRRREAGVVMVLTALMMVAILVIVAIVIDGGQGLADRRQMQNAADAAAFAGARVLSQVRLQSSTSELDVAVRDVAAQNRANPDLVTCHVIDISGTKLAPCAPTSGWEARRDAVGVLVSAGLRRKTLFGNLAGVSELTPSATGAAAMQKLASARSPWMICGNAALPGGFNLIDPLTRSLRPDGVLKTLYGAGGSALPDSRGIPIAGKLPATCGLSSSFNGLIDPASQPVRLGAFALADRGKQVGRYQYDDILAGVGSCPANFADGEATSCLALIPIFDQIELATQSGRIAAWAVWRIRYDPFGTVKYRGQFVSAGVAAGGVTTSEPIDGGSTVVLRLTQ